MLCADLVRRFNVFPLSSKSQGSNLNNICTAKECTTLPLSKRLLSKSNAGEPARRIDGGERWSVAKILLERVEDDAEFFIAPRSCMSREVGAVKGREGGLRVERRGRDEGGGGDEVVSLLGLELEDLGLDPGDGGDGELRVSPCDRVECFEDPIEEEGGLEQARRCHRRRKRRACEARSVWPRS